ncbi:HlyD family type I secretion periplasmic adaptor subunit [Mesorhizobium kowhaii]|uniref:HlyD family type I secretion periplasmic adaptor subunit n=1 Tax=Mesorhizobium kowhaii TaxID=1300272 RepID=UPI00366B162F
MTQTLSRCRDGFVAVAGFSFVVNLLVLTTSVHMLAQRDSLREIVFPPDLVVRRGETPVAEAIAGQKRIFSDQAEVVRSQVEVWQQRIAQYRAQISALASQIDATERQIPSFQEELKDARSLLKKGFGLKSRALDLEQQLAASEGDAAANRARIESLKQQIAEAGAQIENVKATQVKTASEDLRDVQTKRSELERAFLKTSARAGRRDILAPEDGVVTNLRYHTPGGVVAPGGDVLDLVPSQDKMVLDVKIQPLDIDVVRPGLPATVRLVAFKQRVTPTLEGVLTRVSADAVLEERSGTTYFSATVEVNANQLKELPHVKLYPGMPVDVSIVTGQRTMFEYLFQPFADSFAHAFRED